MTGDERDWLIDTLAHENARHKHAGFWRSLAGWRTIGPAFLYYSAPTAIYIPALFTPHVINGSANSGAASLSGS